MTDSASPTRLPAWNTLAEAARKLSALRTETLFAADPRRFERFSLEHDGLLADFSKQRVDDATLQALLALASEAGVAKAVQALFNGEPLNFTEGRAALHMSLRGSCPPPAGDAPMLADTSRRMRRLAADLRDGTLHGAHGDPVRHVVNLGIGGSDLGPRMAQQALSGREPAPVRVDFVANIDPRELDETLRTADPRSTLFIVSSKSFATQETLANANAAKQWLRAALGEDADLSAHFVAISNHPERAQAFGIAPERLLPIPNWVGGRFSVWSAIGLPLMIAIGEQGFDALLAGGRSIDEHFRDAPAERNIPLWMALTGIWNLDFLDCQALAVLPYAHGLRSFPAWLQQLDMESNGKRCRRDGLAVDTQTAPVVFGHEGTVGQHAFHQLLYQGTRRVAADFIVPVGEDGTRQQALILNALAQSAALMQGRNLDASKALLRKAGSSEAQIERLAPHLVCPGNLSSTTLLVPALTPYSLGQLLAAYEHKTFVQGWIWGINSFDQYGVELGKEMARDIASDHGPNHPATEALLDIARRMRERGG